jgi:hypothetical protein
METLKSHEEREVTKMKSRWSVAALLVLAGVVAVSLALSPSAALAKEFKYAGPPAFTVTYPGYWTQDSENPNKALLRTKQEGSLPIMEIQCVDAPAGTTVANASTWLKERYQTVYQTPVTVNSDKQATLKGGIPCNELVITWQYQGFLDLQTNIVSTVKDGKLVYVAISLTKGKAPLWDVGRSLTFK